MPAVIANQFKIRDSSAILLAAKMYPRLLGGFSVDEALFEARQAIFQAGNLLQRDWGTPVLYLREPSGVLFPPSGPPADAAMPARATGFIDIANTFGSIEGEVIDVIIQRVSGGTIQIKNTVNEVKPGGKFTSLKIDSLG